MSKWAQAGIGIAVIALALAVIFGINHRNNSETIEALTAETVPAVSYAQEETTEESHEDMTAPVANDVIYVAKNSLRPGMTDQEIVAAVESASGNDAAAEGPTVETETQETESVPMEGLFQAGEEAITWNGATYKRNAHVKADLLIGVDDYGSADFLAVAAHDTSRNSIKILMIPRDSMMEMYELDRSGRVTPLVTHIKFAHAGQGTSADKAGRTVDAVEALLCGTKIDHYMSGEIPLLAQINDLVGGVPVTVPNDELQKVDPAWTRGAQIVLHGQEAEKFIRYRDIGIDGTPLVRMDQHSAFMAGFFNRLREDSSLIDRVSDFVEQHVTTDMSKGEYEKLMLDGLQSGFDPQRDVLTYPGKPTVGKEGNGVYDQYYVNYEEAIPVLLDLFYRKVS